MLVKLCTAPGVCTEEEWQTLLALSDNQSHATYSMAFPDFPHVPSRPSPDSFDHRNEYRNESQQQLSHPPTLPTGAHPGSMVPWSPMVNFQTCSIGRNAIPSTIGDFHDGGYSNIRRKFRRIAPKKVVVAPQSILQSPVAGSSGSIGGAFTSKDSKKLDSAVEAQSTRSSTSILQVRSACICLSVVSGVVSNQCILVCSTSKSTDEFFRKTTQVYNHSCPIETIPSGPSLLCCTS